MIKFAFLSLSLVITTSAHAIGTRGGGTTIETGFRNRTMFLLSEAQDMRPEQKRLLRFDPDHTVLKLNRPEAFNPLCGSGSELAELQRLHKMAFVFDPASRVVSLDCTKYSEQAWKAKFASESDDDVTFFIHEALRIAGVADNDMLASSSFVTAKRAAPDYTDRVLAKTMFQLLDGRNPKCGLVLPDISLPLQRSAVWEVVFYVNGRAFDKVSLLESFPIEKVRAALFHIGMPTQLNRMYTGQEQIDTTRNLAIQEFRQRVLFQAKELGCFQ